MPFIGIEFLHEVAYGCDSAGGFLMSISDSKGQTPRDVNAKLAN